MWVYFRTVNFIPLTFIFITIAHCVVYCRFVLSCEIGNIFFPFQYCLASSVGLKFPYEFRTSSPISLRNPAGISI